jgi:16S rRNA (guanine527-N7)-methyltransferase
VPAVQLLADGARALGIRLSDDQLNAFQTYYEMLVAWNARVNLTRITEHEAVQTKHFLDSLSCLAAIRRYPALSAGMDAGLGVMDVGSGAGFPGLPLKIAFPALRLTLLEATAKKTAFLQAAVERLGLSGVVVLTARAEEAGQDPARREGYDLVLARALADMAVLAELTLPLARAGGWVVAQKGEDPAAEVATAQKAVELLGGRVAEVLPVAVPGLEAARHLVVLEKIAATPPGYPRRPGLPAKRPLA